MHDFLSHLSTAAQSTIALVAYLFVVAAWSLKAWLRYRPQRKAKEILALYSSDFERTQALAELLGNAPPSGLKPQQILTWVSLQSKRQSRLFLIIAYLATLFTVLTVIGMALFYPESWEASRPPELIESTVQK